MQTNRFLGIQLLLATRPLGFAIVCGAGSCLAADFSGQVVRVSDGDTISVMREGRAVAVRLEGIDCPENGQPFSRVAKETTSNLVFGREVRVSERGADRYGRIVGRVFVAEIDVSLDLVRRGVAWHFRRYSDERALAEAERDAKKAKTGLWIDPDPIPPWEWRRQRRDRRRIAHLLRPANLVIDTMGSLGSTY